MSDQKQKEVNGSNDRPNRCSILTVASFFILTSLRISTLSKNHLTKSQLTRMTFSKGTTQTVYLQYHSWMSHWDRQ